MSIHLIDVRIENRPEGRVAHVTVNNAEHRNRLGRQGKEDLIAAFRALSHDDALRAVVLTGAGDRSFIAGSDLKEMQNLDAEGQRDVSTKTHLACDAIRNMPVPVIARINGYCLGSGMEIAACCDMRAAIPTARFGLPEVQFGTAAGMEACVLPMLIGWGKTREIVFTGESIGAAEAYHFGFLNRMADSVDDLDACVAGWVDAICRAGPRAVRIQKALVRDWERMSIADAVQSGIRAMVETRKTDEPIRYMQRFVDRRKPGAPGVDRP